MTREEQITNEANIRYSGRISGTNDLAVIHASGLFEGFHDGAQWADANPVNPRKDEEIKKELKLISEWFDHVAQMAHNKKTANGFVMKDSDAFEEIECLAKNSADYIRTTLL